MSDLNELETTTSPIVRNDLALRLAQTRDLRVLDALTRLIERPDLQDERGTLVHCLSFFDPTASFKLLIRLVIEGNWEVAHEAAMLLERINVADGREVFRAKKTVDLALEDQKQAWRRDLLNELAESFI